MRKIYVTIFITKNNYGWKISTYNSYGLLVQSSRGMVVEKELYETKKDKKKIFLDMSILNRLSIYFVRVPELASFLCPRNVCISSFMFLKCVK